ncbi:hypothetical protein BHE74_00051479, partial [Ensete ventricosum]
MNKTRKIQTYMSITLSTLFIFLTVTVRGELDDVASFLPSVERTFLLPTWGEENTRRRRNCPQATNRTGEEQWQTPCFSSPSCSFSLPQLMPLEIGPVAALARRRFFSRARRRSVSPRREKDRRDD